MSGTEPISEMMAAATQTSVPPRKRRRRAPATGATEDCFTCRKRNTQCDRRRPYCQQCLDIGKECSGYRTTLTWGVGVASRGKLRGKTLPIANAPKATGAQRKQSSIDATSPTMSASARSNSTASSVDVKPDMSSPVVGSIAYGNATATDPQRSMPQCSSPVAMGPIVMPQGANPNFNYAAASGYSEQLDFSYGLARKQSGPNFRPLQLQRLQTHLVNPFDEGSLSAPSTGSVSDFGDFPSPAEYPHSPADIPFTDPFVNAFPDPYTAQHSTTPTNAPMPLAIPRSYPGVTSEHLSSSVGSDFTGMDQMSHSPALSSAYGFGPGTPDSFHNSDVASPSIVPEGFDYVFGPQPVRTSITSHPSAQLEDAADVPSSLSLPNRSNIISPATLRRSLDSSPFHLLSSRTRELLEYYDRMVCPFLVAFDGPGNPYRMHILHLAMNSEGLQNAIAALSMTNMRQRQIYEIDGQGTKIVASEEEQQYKTKSITKLNAQLANGSVAQDDSVLATLLILCLFHVCDTGFSKFKTQLAGVQKLLRMRNNDRSLPSASDRSFITWIEMFFTWLDAMNSTVNDREMEVKGDSLDMADLSANLGSLEHLAGCEGRLFKLIARLGRLNLLSQGRPVRSEDEHVTWGESDARLTAAPDKDQRTLLLTPRQPTASLTNLDFLNLDGNGWGSPLTSKSPTPMSTPPATAKTPTSALRSTLHAEKQAEVMPAPHREPSDHRDAFWTEWTNIRSRLDQWDFSFEESAAGPQHDVAHISHAFHAAALLYTERLANASLAPSSQALQKHVRTALSYIRDIPEDSCVNKFLLWPLFIVGTESVSTKDRALVRDRIVGVTKESGFFNNMAGLELLEKIWADDDLEILGTVAPTEPDRHAFRWRKLLESMPGEYIVV